MQLIHRLSQKSIKKTVPSLEGRSLMAGKDGGCLWLGAAPASRYQGWFFETGAGLLKILDDAQIVADGSFETLENKFFSVKRGGKDRAQEFFLFGNDCLACETAGRVYLEPVFDIKDPRESPELGRHYSVWEEDGLLLIDYRQDARLCWPRIFIAIAGDFKSAKIKNQWFCRDYDFDKKRNSPPFSRWVFLPARILASRLVFAAAAEKDAAKSRATAAFNEFEARKFAAKKTFENARGSNWLSDSFIGKTDIAKTAAANSLRMLVKVENGALALRAGWPWFFQIWPRDEAISLEGLSIFDKKTARDIFWRQIEELKKNDYRAGTADAAGWLFSRAAGFLKKNEFDGEEKQAVSDVLERHLGRLLKSNTRNFLAANNANEPTWMDSLDRSGAAIEIQALRLNMYRLAAKMADSAEKKEHYQKLEEDLLSIVQKTFFDGKNLFDRFDIDKNKFDEVVRPNVFLAAYAYPELLAKAEWRAVFENALQKLWLDWGGLATIDKTDPRFCPQDTGQEAAAYHNGDSWFWVNNIAAIVMSRADRKYFLPFIEKIFVASRHDILWGGALGCASEISSADKFDPAGCPNQAWSAATFLELCRELKK